MNGDLWARAFAAIQWGATEMARGRSAGYEEQREQILAHAAELFAQRGYPATSMNEVAQACGLSKPTIYHYFRDKYALLFEISHSHVSHLQALVQQIESQALPPQERLRAFILSFVHEYADARFAHRVLTEDVRFLQDEDRQQVHDKERYVVNAFSEAVESLRPDLAGAGLSKALTMLLFGMMNWMFTWLKPRGALTHEMMAPVVADLFMGGIDAVKAMQQAA